jgi:hypothetical protein
LSIPFCFYPCPFPDPGIARTPPQITLLHSMEGR